MRYNYTLFIFIYTCCLTQTHAQLNTRPQLLTSTHNSSVSELIFSNSGDKLYSLSADGQIIIWDISDLKFKKENSLNVVIPSIEVGSFSRLSEVSDTKLSLVVRNNIQNTSSWIEIDIINRVITKQVPLHNVGQALHHTYIGNKQFIVFSTGQIIVLNIDDFSIESKSLGFDIAYADSSIDGFDWVFATSDEHQLEYKYDGNKGDFIFGSKRNRHYLPISEIEISKNDLYFTASHDGKVMKNVLGSSRAVVIDRLDRSINKISVSENGQYCVVFEETTGAGHIYNTNGTELIQLNIHDNTVSSVATKTTTQGEILVVSSGGHKNQLVLWSMLTGHIYDYVISEGGIIWDLNFDNEKRKLSIASGENVEFYNLQIDLDEFKSTIVRNQKIPIARSEPYGFKLLSNYELRIPSGVKIENDLNLDGRILSYTSIGDQIFVGSDFSLKVYSARGLNAKKLHGHTGGVRSITYDSKMDYLVTGGDDQWIRFYDLNDSLNQKFSLFIDRDREFVLCSNESYFTSSEKGSKYLTWLAIGSELSIAREFPADQYFNILYKPEILRINYDTDKNLSKILSEQDERIFKLSEIERPSAALIEAPYFKDESSKIFLKQIAQTFISEENSDVIIPAQIYDGGGGIAEVQLYQNGKIIALENDFEDNIPKQKRSYQASLMPGINEFTIKVVNFQGIESKIRQKVTIEYQGKASANSNLYVFAIGINKYNNSKYNLNYAEPDARSFLDQITSSSEGIFEKVIPVVLFNEDVSRTSIKEKFDLIAKEARLQDVLIFYYAGHGVMATLEDGNQEYYMVTPQVTKMYGANGELVSKGFSSQDLKKYTAEIKAQKQLILIDACNSGGAIASMAKRGAAEEKAIFQLARSSGVVLISASGTQQFATEFAELGHGAFTYVLLEGLKGAADGGEKDAKITVNELKAYMEDKVPELTFDYGGTAQYPTGFSAGQDFPISIVK